MINSIKCRFLLVIALVCYTISYAQDGPGGFFPPPENPKNPIDMYVYVLMAVAVIFIAIFAKKRSKVNA